jgi:hypothetical protein
MRPRKSTVPGIVWGRHSQEAYDNPYEYAAQEQFLRESMALLRDLCTRPDYRLNFAIRPKRRSPE